MGSITPLDAKKKRSECADEEEWNRVCRHCKLWKLEVACGTDRNGDRVRHTKRFHGTKSEAKKALAEFEAYWGLGTVEDITLEAFCDIYLKYKAELLETSGLKTTTSRVATVRYLFGDKTKLSQITPQRIDEAMLELLNVGGPAGRPCKPAYVGMIFKQLKSILYYALRTNHLARDPIPLCAEYSSKAPKRKEIPHAEALNRVLRAIDVRDYHQMAVLLSICLGLRRQEAVALQFDDIDYDARVVHIRHVVTGNVKSDEKVVERAKTDAGVRDLPLPTFMDELLEKRRQALEADIEFALRNGIIEERPEVLYICANKDGQRPSLTSITKWWGAHRAGFGCHCALHDLRHAYVTLLAERKQHPIVAAALAGHSTIRTTMDVYTVARRSQIEEAVRDLEGVFDFGPESLAELTSTHEDKPGTSRGMTRRARMVAGEYDTPHFRAWDDMRKMRRDEHPGDEPEPRHLG